MSANKLGYLVLCDAHTKAAGKDCLIGVFNRIFVGRFPAVHEACFLAFELWTTPGDHKLMVRIKDSQGEDVRIQDQSGKEVSLQLGPLDMKVSAVGQASGAIQLRNLPLQKPGIYSFVVEIDGEPVGARDLIVDTVPQQRPAQG